MRLLGRLSPALILLATSEAMTAKLARAFLSAGERGLVRGSAGVETTILPDLSVL